MVQIHNVQQNTPEWDELRLKYPLTASKAQAIGNQKEGLESLCWDQIAKIYSLGEKKEEYTNKDLERGKELEPTALSLYELETGNSVQKVGFITNDEISKVGGSSPDGLVNDDGLVEVKAFDDTKHFKAVIEFKKTGKFKIESQYIWQMNMQMLFSERKWCDFLAFNPNYGEALLITRVFPDMIMQEKIRTGLKKGEIIINEIKNYYGK